MDFPGANSSTCNTRWHYDDWLTDGNHAGVRNDASEIQWEPHITEVSSGGSSADEMQCSDEDDSQYVGDEDDVASEDDLYDEEDESDSSFDIGSDLDCSSESDFSWDDEEEFPQTQEDFLRYDDEFNDIFANDELDPIPESQVYVGGRINLSIGMDFNTVELYRDHLRMHAIQHNYEYILKKNDTNRVTAICAHPPCKWRCHASKLSEQLTFRVKTMNPLHICASRAQSRNKIARSSFVTNMIVRKLRERNKEYSPREIKVDIQIMFGINISYHIAWYSRIKALEMVYGNYDQAYIDTPELGSQIISTHSRNKAKWSISSDRTFKSVFICFYVAAQSWRMNCRPVIGLDGCFLKGKYGGVLLSATGIDGNGGLYPIAFSICTSEDKGTWKAFLKEMQDVLREEPLTFYSDRQKGLIQAVKEEFPTANHRFCMRHIYANFEKKFKGDELRKLVYAGEFNDAMRKLKAADRSVFARITIPPK